MSFVSRSRSIVLLGHVMTCGGVLYKELLSGGLCGELPGDYVTVTFNTDGIPVFKSSNYSFWPMFLLINELPYKQRCVHTHSI